MSSALGDSGEWYTYGSDRGKIAYVHVRRLDSLQEAPRPSNRPNGCTPLDRNRPVVEKRPRVIAQRERSSNGCRKRRVFCENRPG